MSAFYDLASLVFLPSGYKSGKLYAQKPLTTDGQLAFTRASSATRVASNGLIEKVRTNLILQSNTFSDAAWTKTNFTITAGQSDPFGGSNAWKFECTSTSGGMIQTVAGSGVRAVSIYAKAGNVSTFSLWRGGILNVGVSFNLSTGTIISGIGTITPVGNGWYRCSTFGDTAHVNPFFNSPSSGDFIFLAFSQLENSDIATDYIPTTTAAVSVGPVSGLPRLDYLGSTCPRLLLEPQRTNVALYSEQFDNAAWNKETGNSVVANSVTSPDGYTNADSISATSGNVININQGLTTPAATATYTFSGFFKKQSTSSVEIYLFQVVGGFVGRASINLDAGTITASVGTATITNYGNGWYRASVTGTLTIAIVSSCGIYNASTTGTRNVYAYGCQVEIASYATSYIPTLGASVTRVADAASKTGISSLIGQTEGTLFADFEFNGKYDVSGNIPILIYTGTSEAYIFISTAGNLFLDILNAGVISASISVPIGAFGRKKIAFAYKANDFVGYMNGVQIGTDTSGTVGAMSIFNVGSYKTAGYSTTGGVNQALLFKTRLTNAQLAELTAL
jgi:hypothetical protein